MTTFDTVFLSVTSSLIVACLLIQARNKAVWRFRLALLGRIPVTDRAMFRSMIDEFERVSYLSQVVQFWRPLPSFWPAGSVLRTAGVLEAK